MQLHQLQRVTKNKDEKRVGRGGKRGKTAGRGTKGQKARAGHRIRPELRDIIKKYPKMRGRGKNTNKAFRIKPTPVNLDLLEKSFKGGEVITPTMLVENNVISRVGGKIPKVKILATGSISKALTIESCTISIAAKQKIEAVGGSVKA